jgi:hypothetical protein
VNALVFMPVSWLLVACSLKRNGREIMVTRDQAIEAAKRELTKHGHAVSDYDITVDPENPTEDYWMIWFDKKGPFPVPGGKHGVRVNKSTGHVEFMPGE